MYNYNIAFYILLALGKRGSPSFTKLHKTSGCPAVKISKDNLTFTF